MLRIAEILSVACLLVGVVILLTRLVISRRANGPAHPDALPQMPVVGVLVLGFIVVGSLRMAQLYAADPPPMDTWRQRDAVREREEQLRVRPTLRDRTGAPGRALVRYRWDGTRAVYGPSDSILLPVLAAGGPAQRWMRELPRSVPDTTAGALTTLTIDRDLQRTAQRLLAQHTLGRGVAVIVDGRSGATRALAEQPLPADSLLPSLFTKHAIAPASLFKVPTAAAAISVGDLPRHVAAPGRVIVGRRAVSNAGGRDYGRITFPEQVLAYSPFTAMREPARALRTVPRGRLTSVLRDAGIRLEARGTSPSVDTAFWRGGTAAWRAAQAPIAPRWALHAESGPLEFLMAANGQDAAQSSSAGVMRLLHAYATGRGTAPRYTVWSDRACPTPERVVRTVPAGIPDGLTGAATFGTARALSHGAVRKLVPSAPLFAKTATAQRAVPGGRLVEDGMAFVALGSSTGPELPLVAFVWMETTPTAQAVAVADTLLAAAVRGGLGVREPCTHGSTS